jgi:hypothetical protein
MAASGSSGAGCASAGAATATIVTSTHPWMNEAAQVFIAGIVSKRGRLTGPRSLLPIVEATRLPIMKKR